MRLPFTACLVLLCVPPFDASAIGLSRHSTFAPACRPSLCDLKTEPDGQPDTHYSSGQFPATVSRRVHYFTLDVGAVSLAPGYALRLGGHAFVGLRVGLGPDALNYMIVAGSHFAEGPSYEPKDEYGNERLLEILHLDIYVRLAPSAAWHIDVGVRGSAFLHWDDSDDDPGGGLFFGAVFRPMWGGRKFKVGPRFILGSFSEPRRSEFGVNVAPVTISLTF